MKPRPCCFPVIAAIVFASCLVAACDGSDGAAAPGSGDLSTGDGSPSPDVVTGDVAAGDASADDASADDATALPPPPGPCTLTNRDPETGAVLAILHHVWDGDRLLYIEVDEAGDGSIDDQWEYEYREDGSMSRREGIGYPTNPYDATYVPSDDGTSMETHVDRDGDGQVDEVWVTFYDDEGRIVRTEFGDYYVILYSAFDEWDNATRTERMVPPDDQVVSTCTRTWRGPREMLQEECVDADGDVMLRTTVTWEDDRQVLRVSEATAGTPGDVLTERWRTTYAYDERGWLSVEVRLDTERADYELTYDYDCWGE